MSKKQIQPIDLTNYLSRPIRNRVYRIGVELEGGWSKLPPGCSDSSIQRDSSVRFTEAEAVTGKLKYSGEMPSPILDPEAEEFPQWLKQMYPTMINLTCGMHVHMSFRNALIYQRLMVEEYPFTVAVELVKWAQRQSNFPLKHHIWDRLAGRNEFCRLEFHPDKQASVTRKDFDHHREGHRYTAIHYCFGRTGTVECRLLPMMETVDQALDAIRMLLKITSAFLVATAKREQPTDLSWKAEQGPSSEEFILCV